MSSNDISLKEERNRFVKLAFCRADLLFELDNTFNIAFTAGATDALFGKKATELIGTPFLDLVCEKVRGDFASMLDKAGRDERIDDEPVSLACLKGLVLPAIAAGYRVAEFDNHVFLAVKIASPASQQPSPKREVLDQEGFSQLASHRIKAASDAGTDSQVSLVRIRKFGDLVKSLGASDRQGLTSAIFGVLNNYSLGGDTAGQLNEENFGYVHTRDVDPEKVSEEIEEAAQPFLGADENLETSARTLDADGAGMTEDQVARALVHTMQQFCNSRGKTSTERLSDSLDEMMEGTVEIVRYIKHVTEEQDFDLAFMPICDLRLGKVHHFEALSRFKDKEKAKSTFQVITLAENLGLIARYDYAVMDKAITLISDFSRRGPLPSIAINLSGASLGSDAFVSKLQKRLKPVPDLHKHLMFEMTESAEVDDLVRINNVIQSFREQGFKFCLDDFGAGSASFDYLNALEVDIVKFDGPVIRRACASKRGHDLLNTMAKMCSTSGIQTVAEMVEDKKIANQVFYCGIDYGQGWFFGKPAADPFTFESNFVGQSG